MHHLLVLLLSLIQLANSSQLSLSPDSGSDQLYSTITSTFCPLANSTSGIELSTEWSVLGPFPSGMREHQLGAFPALTMLSLTDLFSLSNPVEIPSTYGTAGIVTAQAFRATEHAQSQNESGVFLSARAWQSVRISYPKLDWKAIQQTEGWAGLQWQAMAVTSLRHDGQSPAMLSITLDSAAEFAVLSEEEYINYTWDNCSSHVKWYNGDWYSYTRENSVSNSDAPAHLLTLRPGRYKILVKAVYEVRIFGGMKDAAPVIEYGLDVRIRKAGGIGAVTAGQFSVVPDVVDGMFAGWGVSFPLQNYWQQSVQVHEVKIVGGAEKYLNSQSSDLPLVLAPLQLRPIKFQVASMAPLPVRISKLIVRIAFRYNSRNRHLDIHLPLKHVELLSAKETSENHVQYQYTYLDSDQTIQYALATAPKIVLAAKSSIVRPALLHLHGAGVDVRLEEARNTFLRQNDSWIIEPSGRSPWGYDWQIASRLSARTAMQQFSLNMYGLSESVKCKAAKIDENKVMITGHSNGGQGAYHFASHRPDDVLGVVAGAGYISLANYVSMNWQLGRHFNDAALSGVLRSSLNAFDNDLFASNMAGLPMLLKYGSMDDNVPIWHSREMASLIEMWNRQSHADHDHLVKVSEVPDKSHYWPDFMKESDVQSAIDARLGFNPGYRKPLALDHFTLSVFNPEDMGSKQGWKITQVEVPGRLGRLEVEYRDGGQTIKVRSAHVLEVQVNLDAGMRNTAPKNIYIDGAVIMVSEATRGKKITLRKARTGWSEVAKISTSRPIGPMIRFLSSRGPIVAIVPTGCAENVSQHYYSIALRFSTDAYLYGRLDTVILYDHQALQAKHLHSYNVLLLGGSSINKVSRLVSASQTVIDFLDGSFQFKIQDRIYAEGSTLLALFPHPFAGKEKDLRKDGIRQPKPLALLLHGTDSLSMERGYSLLPVRTGTLLPEWIVVDKSSMWKGYGGVVAAGWYDHDWAWSGAMSYLS